jgi:hypothetical protein
MRGVVPSLRFTWVGVDYRPPSQGCKVPGSGDLFWYGRFRSLVGRACQRGVRPCQRGFTCCHNDHDDYLCSHGRVPMSGTNGLETNTRVPLCQVHVGAYGYVPSWQNSSGAASQEPGCYGACPVLNTPRVARRISSAQTGGKTLSVHGHHDGGRTSMVRS